MKIKFNLFKKGGNIHIKESTKGSFTKYCKGKVTQECIDKAKKSGNKKLVKKAVFAENSRKWSKKHQLGGIVQPPYTYPQMNYGTMPQPGSFTTPVMYPLMNYGIPALSNMTTNSYQNVVPQTNALLTVTQNAQEMADTTKAYMENEAAKQALAANKQAETNKALMSVGQEVGSAIGKPLMAGLLNFTADQKIKKYKKVLDDGNASEEQKKNAQLKIDEWQSNKIKFSTKIKPTED